MSNALIEPEHHKHELHNRKKDGVVPKSHRTQQETEGKAPKSKPGRHGGHRKGHKAY